MHSPLVRGARSIMWLCGLGVIILLAVRACSRRELEVGADNPPVSQVPTPPDPPVAQLVIRNDCDSIVWVAVARRVDAHSARIYGWFAIGGHGEARAIEGAWSHIYLTRAGGDSSLTIVPQPSKRALRFPVSFSGAFERSVDILIDGTTVQPSVRGDAVRGTGDTLVPFLEIRAPELTAVCVPASGEKDRTFIDGSAVVPDSSQSSPNPAPPQFELADIVSRTDSQNGCDEIAPCAFESADTLSPRLRRLRPADRFAVDSVASDLALVRILLSDSSRLWIPLSRLSLRIYSSRIVRKE